MGVIRMKIEDVFIGDGQINKYILENGTLTMEFEDYCNSRYKIILEGCEYVSVTGSVGFSLSSGKFKKTKAGEVWFFYDEDGEVLELRFDRYSMSLVE